MNKIFVRSAASAGELALRDIADGLRQFGLAAFLAWDDIRQRYVRTMLGPLWIVLTTGIWFGAMGFVMANLFGQSLGQYMPFMASGLLMWLLISTSIAESSQVLIVSAPLITTFPIPIFTHYLRLILRNTIIFLHNLLILVIVLVIFPPEVNATTWLVVPGLLLDMVILLGLSVVLSLVNLRYRDTHLAVASAMQVLPFVTPIFWDKPMLQGHRWIADINPFYHMIEIVRAPALGHAPAALSWQVDGGLAVFVLVLAVALFARFRHRIIFWL
jgi:homopolymeric O-antigen transport system permease protein